MTVVDEVMARAWPALVVERHGSWTLRWTHGVSRRANSVLTLGEGDDGLLAAVERFYRARGARPLFQVSEASTPAAVAERLLQRGYERSTRTLVMTASTAQVRRRTSPGAWRVAVVARPTDAWFRAYWGVEGRGASTGERARVCRSVLLAPRLPVSFVQVEGRAGATGVGQAVVVDGWGVVQCMATPPASRRRGAAGAVLHALAGTLAADGVEQLCLAVLAENGAAVRRYEAAGFTVAHAYEYYAATA